MFCVYWEYAEQRILSKHGKIFLFLNPYMTPLYLLKIVFSKFDPLTASGMALYLKISKFI